MADDSTPTKPRKSVDDFWKTAPTVNASDAAERSFAVEVWKQTVAVQMHFNDICMKIRNFAITLLAGVVGLTAYSAKDAVSIHVFSREVPIGALICFGGLIGWVAFWAMDRHWYHVFLVAAGKHASNIEGRWRSAYPELQLSSQIGEDSRRMVGTWVFHSGRRLSVFYLVGAGVLLFTAVGVWNAHVVDRPSNSTPITVNLSPPSTVVVAPATAVRENQKGNSGEVEQPKKKPLPPPKKRVSPPAKR
jgi:hypothetical protein